jgi:cation diffusion facilitator family transporter
VAPSRQATRAALTAVAVNALLVAGKAAAGLATGSFAVLAEAADSTANLAASLMALLAVRMAARPPDRGHPYGHERAENLAAGIEGVLVLAAGGVVAAAAAWRLVAGGSGVSRADLALATVAVGALVSLALARHLRAVARRTASAAIEGDAVHLMADVWTSAGVVAGLALVAATGWGRLDAAVALAVAGWVAVTGARLAWRSAQVLVDSGLSDDEIAVLERALDRFRADGVAFHKLRGRRAGAKRHVDLHMLVPPQTTVREGHVLSGRVKGAIALALPNSEVLIHLEDDPDAPSAERSGTADVASSARPAWTSGFGIVSSERGW